MPHAATRAIPRARTAGRARRFPPPMAARRLRSLVLPLLLLGGWWAAAASGAIDPRLGASPTDVARYLYDLQRQGGLWRAVASSIGRDLAGFALGAAPAVIAGLTLGLFPLLRQALLPTTLAFRHVSMFAWIPLVSVWFGVGESARLVTIALAAWFPVLFATMEGVERVPDTYTDLARVLVLTRWQTVMRVILPAAAPAILSGLSLGLILSWMVTLGAEYMLASTDGVGRLLLDGRENFRMDEVLAGVLLAGGIGFLLPLAGTALQRCLSARPPARHPAGPTAS
ncbi:ABC transporter permease [Gluconacetobacter sp. Hr-1-5]|uniref:ABC transporter permease n=1 Tax=Gluconacetobacter sp. Hr-1-5 TaxID=3395370 RepID=UPI003B52912E